MKKHNKYALIGLRALQRAAAKVAADAIMHNYKIPIWENGLIKYEVPEIVLEQDDLGSHYNGDSFGRQGENQTSA